MRPGPRTDLVGLDDAAEPGDVGVDAALRAGGRILPPDRVDQFATGDHPVSAHRQDAEDGLLPGLAQTQFLIAFPGRHRAKHADTQYYGFADLPLSGPSGRTAAPPGR